VPMTRPRGKLSKSTRRARSRFVVKAIENQMHRCMTNKRACCQSGRNE
jgi:hypothetical protein